MSDNTKTALIVVAAAMTAGAIIIGMVLLLGGS